jgi:chemotaxis protein MotB
VSDSEEGKSHELVIIRRRASEEEGGHHGGVWKIAYADFMTAMMAFFLVMWLINSTDKKTLTQVATYFNPMRLTDKRPSPKGLDESDGSEGKDAPDKKAAKKKDGDTKGQKKSEEPAPGEVRSRGRPFQREMEEIEKKDPKELGATSGESPRQAGGRAFRDPFDSTHRSEIIPNEPSGGKVGRNLPATPAEARPTTSGETKSGSSVEAKPIASGEAKPIASGEAKLGTSIESKPVTTGEAKLGTSIESKPVTTGEATSGTPVDAKLATAGEAKPGAFADAKPANPLQPSREASARTDAARLEAAIKQALSESLPGTLPNIDVTVTPDGVLISLTDDYEFGMFAIASAEPRPAMLVVMDKVAKILQVRPEPLIIRGHTDRRPYRTAAYDNWRLSTARAHMAYVMLVRSGVDEKRFERIEGHADRSLRVEQDPEAAQNRRIEILLRKQTP